MQRLLGILLLLLSVSLALAACAAFVAVLRALAVGNTLAAIEASFGTLVITIFLLVLARKSLKAGRARLSSLPRAGRRSPSGEA